MSLLVICETLGLFVNTLTGDDMYSVLAMTCILYTATNSNAVI